MVLEGFLPAIMRVLGIPPGVFRRPAKENNTEYDIAKNDYIDTMVSITVDDICIGDTPFSVSFKEGTPESVQECLEQIRDEFNSVAKDIARSLCTEGLAILDVKVDKKTNKMLLFHHLDPVEVYLSDKKEIVVFDQEEKEKTNLKDVIVFLNYSKSSLEKIEDTEKEKRKNLKFKINPEPMQLKNVEKTAQNLDLSEQAVIRYRAQLSRIARWVNVDVGVSQGDKQQEVIDSISSAINANSMSLNQQSSDLFDDAIPVVPNRRGIGKPEIVSDIPDANIKELADIDYLLGKLNLLMRFPATYMDFSTDLGSSAVSLIRSDLRYAKMCNAVRSKMATTVNKFIDDSKFSKYEPEYTLTQYPTSEDDDVLTALESYVDLAEKFEEHLTSATTKEERLHRLEQLQSLYQASTTSPALQEWFNKAREYTESLDESLTEEMAASPGPGPGPRGLRGGPDIGEDIDTSEVELDEEDPDIEIIDPVSNDL